MSPGNAGEWIREAKEAYEAREYERADAAATIASFYLLRQINEHTGATAGNWI